MTCDTCGKMIRPERIEASPTTVTCSKKCSKERQLKAQRRLRNERYHRQKMEYMKKEFTDTLRSQ